MPEIISVGTSDPGNIKQNPFQSFKDWFFSLDKVVRFSFVFALAISIASASAGGAYLSLRQFAAEPVTQAPKITATVGTNESIDSQTKEYYDLRVTSTFNLTKNTGAGYVYATNTVFKIGGARINNITALFGYKEENDNYPDYQNVINFTYDSTASDKFTSSSVGLGDRGCISLYKNPDKSKDNYVATFCYNNTQFTSYQKHSGVSTLFSLLGVDADYVGSREIAGMQLLTTAYNKYDYNQDLGMFNEGIHKVNYLTIDKDSSLSDFANVTTEIQGYTQWLSTQDEARICYSGDTVKKYIKQSWEPKPEGGSNYLASPGNGACSFVYKDRLLPAFLSLDIEGGWPEALPRPLDPITLSNPGMKVINYYKDFSINPGESSAGTNSRIFTVTSKYDGNISVMDNPTSLGQDIKIEPNSAGFTGGSYTVFNINVSAEVAPGIYKLKPVLKPVPPGDENTLPETNLYVGIPIPTAGVTPIIPPKGYILTPLPSAMPVDAYLQNFAQVLLKNQSGIVIPDQKDYTFEWESSDENVVTLRNSSICPQGVKLPCVNSSALLFAGKKNGQAEILISARKISLNQIVASTKINITNSTNPITPTPTPKLACNVSCKTNADCASGYCYQEPIPTCPPGQLCNIHAPAKLCRNLSCSTATNCSCPTPTPASAQIPTPKPQVLGWTWGVRQNAVVNIYSLDPSGCYKLISAGKWAGRDSAAPGKNYMTGVSVCSSSSKINVVSITAGVYIGKVVGVSGTDTYVTPLYCIVGIGNTINNCGGHDKYACASSTRCVEYTYRCATSSCISAVHQDVNVTYCQKKSICNP